MIKSGAPRSIFSFNLSLILTISTSLCVKSSSLLSPVSNVIEGLTVTGGIGSKVKISHSGLAFKPIRDKSSSFILSNLSLTADAVKVCAPSTNV